MLSSSTNINRFNQILKLYLPYLDQNTLNIYKNKENKSLFMLIMEQLDYFKKIGNEVSHIEEIINNYNNNSLN